MKRLLILSLLAVITTAQVNAQAQEQPHPHQGEDRHMDGERHHQKREEIKAKKVAFITDKLSLTPGEAEQFWPIYNAMEDKMHENRMARRELRKGKKLDEMSDAEVEAMIDGMMKLEQEELDLKKAFHHQVKGVLPIKKVALLYKAEREFRKELLHKMKGQHRGPGGH